MIPTRIAKATMRKKKWSPLLVVVLPLLVNASQTTAPTARSSSNGPAEIYPRPDLTPGVNDPMITQDNIQATVCTATWRTPSSRPPSAFATERKKEIMARYGLQNQAAERFELNRLIPVELGGSSLSDQ